MSGKRYYEEFKIEAVKQVTDGNYPVRQAASRLDITNKSIYDWIMGGVTFCFTFFLLSSFSFLQLLPGRDDAPNS